MLKIIFFQHKVKMSSKYESTQETKNLALEARIFLGPVTDMLREIIKDIISENKLPSNIAYLKGKQAIMKYQETIINGRDYSQFDISLLCSILQWANGLKNAKRQLNKNSSPKNFERIRIIRNEWYGHAKTFYLSNSDFEKHWKEILQIVKDLEDGELVNSTCHQNSVTYIKSCDGDSDVKCIKVLLDIEKKQIENLTGKYASIT